MKLRASVNHSGAKNMIVQKAGRISAATTKALQIAGQTEVQNTKQRIASEKIAPDGTSWKPWSMSTLRQRQKEGNVSLGLLNRTGALISSIAYKLTKNTLTIFSSASYAKYLQLGTSKMPARPFIGWSTDGVNKVRQLLKELTK